MNLALTGQVVIGLALVAALLALRGARVPERERGLRLWLAVSTGLTVVAVALLWWALTGSDFRFDYVVRNTSRDLPGLYRIAALWAGQEGTILLWTLLLELTAVSMLQYCRYYRRVAPALVTALAAGFLVLLLIRSPFRMVAGAPPEDGHGLNPLLRNPWMVVHPPVLFIGYALLTAPFALALAAFGRNEPDGWLEDARRFALLGWVFLGAGMMLGAYWAYITLGWGGFWAWDPVENSSLIPWIFATALLHCLPLQRRAGACRKLAYVLALATFVTVIYGSYLTRSGVLGDFSVHSFESLGAGYNAGWLALLLVPLALGLGLLARRSRQVTSQPVPAPLTWLYQAVWVITLMATLVLIGTSMPLLSKLAGDGKGFALQPSFYNRTQTLLFLVAALVLVLHLKPTLPALLQCLAGAALGLAAVAGTVQPSYPPTVQSMLAVLGGGCGLFAALALQRGVRACAAGRKAEAGVSLAHLGMALLVLGAAVSGPGANSQRLVLATGQSDQAVGAEVRLSSIEDRDDQKTAITFQVTEGGKVGAGVSLIYPTENGTMRHPTLFHRPFSDLYLEPEELLEGHAHAGNVLELAKGKSGEVAGAKVKFVNYDMGGDHSDTASMMGGVGAKLEVDLGKGPRTVVPRFNPAEANPSPPVDVDGWQISLQQILA
ncbi:MAG: cytochrome c biogenesis protein CcsA, partial [Armatimonadetes bacterium]|nr:cytochrome c biogenesis protein CcsA [Armatimonadota bacterium]